MYEEPKTISAEHYSSKMKVRKQIRFLKALAETGNVTKALQMAIVKRGRWQHWMKSDIAFQERYEQAKEMAADRLEEEAWRRAVDGYDDHVTYQGKAIYHEYPKGHPRAGELMTDWLGDPIPITIRKYSDRMLELLLKGHRPEKFRENIEPQSAFRGGVLIVPMVSGTPEQAALSWEQQLEEHRKASQLTIEHQPAIPVPAENKELITAKAKKDTTEKAKKPTTGGPVVNG